VGGEEIGARAMDSDRTEPLEELTVLVVFIFRIGDSVQKEGRAFFSERSRLSNA
jgi:hypothetical protein